MSSSSSKRFEKKTQSYQKIMAKKREEFRKVFEEVKLKKGQMFPL